MNQYFADVDIVKAISVFSFFGGLFGGFIFDTFDKFFVNFKSFVLKIKIFKKILEYKTLNELFELVFNGKTLSYLMILFGIFLSIFQFLAYS